MNPFERVALGRTPLQVTRLGLGTAPLGGLYSAVSDDDACNTIDAAWSAGIRLFDTAPLYGHGLSEIRLGDVLRTKPRDQFVLATKVGRLLRAPPRGRVDDSHYKGTPPLEPVFDFSFDGVMRSVDESLSRLAMDRIDLLHIHDPDDHYEAALAGAYQALDRLRREGVIGAVGAGMNQWQLLQRFAVDADFDCFLLAGRYSLLDQSAAQTLLPLCEKRAISIIAGGVYNSGILAEPHARLPKFNYADAPVALIERARGLDAICRRHGVALKAAAIQFPFGQPVVDTVLMGARSTAEVDENVAMMRVDIPPGLWDDIRSQGLLAPMIPVPNL